MKLQILSDIHILQWPKSWWDAFPQETQTDADVLILAGDIVALDQRHFEWSLARLREFGARYKHVLMVPGNHEFYGTSIEDGLGSLLAAEATLGNVQVLTTGEVVEIEGRRFLGDTGWFPDPGDDGAWEINDHRCIRDFIPYVYEEHDRFRSFLDTDLRKGDVVVSHHLPSAKSIHPQWKGYPTNAFFVSPEIEQDFIVPRQPSLWVHGHSHSAFDYRIGQTRVVAEPIGYPGERDDINWKKVVELDSV